MKKIRVLHIIKTLSFGGAESNLYNLVCAFDPKNVKCHVAYSVGGPYEEKLKNKGFRLFKYATKEHKVKSWASALIVLQLVFYMIRHRIRVVHTHNYNAHVWGSLAAKITGARLLEHVHDSRYESNFFLKDRGLPETVQFDQAKYFAKLSDSIAVLTRANRDYLIDHDIVPADKVRLVLNGIPLNDVRPDANNLRKELSLPEDKKIVFRI